MAAATLETSAPKHAFDEAVALERSLRGTATGYAPATVGLKVPVIDLQDPSAADEMWKAATTVGFFTVTNHGIPQSAIDDTFAVSREFFALDKEDKYKASPFAKNMNSGYEFMEQVRPSTGTADQKESLQITARTAAMDGRWPQSPARFQSTSSNLMAASHALATQILCMLERKACPLLEEGTLARAHTLWSDGGQCTLRMLHYPPTEPYDHAAATDKAAKGPRVWRAGPHTDWTTITLLFQRPGGAGLECASNPNAPGGVKDGWVAVDPMEGGIAINIGDMLSRWSDGKLYSNLHRVRMPTPDECKPPKSRYSIAFFMQADKEALIESETNEPITAGDYILHRIQSNY